MDFSYICWYVFMQVEIRLTTLNDHPLEYSYNHALGSALVRALSSVNPVLGHDLHDGAHKNRLKLFAFSTLNSQPHPEQITMPSGEKRLKFGKRLWLRFASVWPEVTFSLGEALINQKELDIAGLRLRVDDIIMAPTPAFKETMTYRCFGQSGMIVARYQQDGPDRFQFPDNPEKNIPSCEALIAANLRHKILRLGEIRKDIQANYLTLSRLEEANIRELPIKVEFLPLTETRAYRTGLYRIKNMNVRAFRCPVRITAPEIVHQIVWNCGLGGQNTQGFGLVTLGEKNDVSQTNR